MAVIDVDVVVVVVVAPIPMCIHMFINSNKMIWVCFKFAGIKTVELHGVQWQIDIIPFGID